MYIKIAQPVNLRVLRNEPIELVTGASDVYSIFKDAAVRILRMQSVTVTRCCFDLTMTSNLISHAIAVSGTAASGVPTAGHSPGDQFFQAINQSAGRRVVIGRMIVAKGGKPEAVIIAPVVR